MTVDSDSVGNVDQLDAVAHNKDFHTTRLDHAIATFLSKRCEKLDANQYQRFKSLVTELSSALAKGHSCIRVNAQEQQLLEQSGLVSANGNTPLILEENRLYLQRYWHYETRLALALRYKATHPPAIKGDTLAILERYFPCTENTKNETDWQREAANNVIRQSFSIITGGPGTGKTTTILKILAMIQEIHLLSQGGKENTGDDAGDKRDEGNNHSNNALKIALAAPTGKAANRLQESIGEGRQTLPCNDQIKQLIPCEVSTIHRLLGAKPASVYFRHDAKNPLVFDLVVIDEASMVDLALMSKLVDALKPAARLIVIGDKDQLASVESGAILSDLSAGLPENTSELKKSWRFVAEIKALAQAINQQDKKTAWDLLNSKQYQATSRLTEPLLTHIMNASQSYFSCIQDNTRSADRLAIFTAYKHFQVLCSNRRGKWGVEGINHQVELRLLALGINTARPWYHGKPVIITRNDPGTQLFNGDIGICLRELPHETGQGSQHSEALYVYFQQADGHIKKLLPARLPHHDTAYALTVHKSQGSEFEHVLVVLPDKPNPVISKELIYTAITRAKKTVEVASTEVVFNYALDHQVQRNSGLKTKVMSIPQV